MRLEIGIIALVEEVLGVPTERRAKFEWLVNKPAAHLVHYYPLVMDLFKQMGGDRRGMFAKMRITPLVGSKSPLPLDKVIGFHVI